MAKSLISYTCLTCGHIGETKRKAQKYCSVECSSKRNINDGSKKCVACDQVKPLSDFRARSRFCKPCHNEKKRRDYLLEPEKHKAYVAKYCDKNRDQKRSRDMELYYANRERRLQQQKASKERNITSQKTYKQRPDVRAKACQAALRWQKRNSDKVSEYELRRRSRQKNAPVVEVIDRSYIIQRDDHTCYICGNKCYGRNCHLDHVTPLYRGGHHTVDNLHVACGSCNSRKGALLLSEYIERFGEPAFHPFKHK